MTRTSRRGVLALLGAGTATLAGCSALSPGESAEPDVDTDAVARTIQGRSAPAVPAVNPLCVPDGAIDRHRGSADEALAAVPADLSVPNGTVTQRLREQRSRTVEELDAAAEGAPLERLATWRDRRGEAVNVARAYAAATGDADPEAYRERHEEVRSDRASLAVSVDYRAPDPVAATAAFATLEELLETARNRLDPRAPLPERPVDAVFRVGDRWEAVATARAEVADARRLRDAYREGTDGEPHRTRLAAASQRLERSYRATRSRVSAYVGAEPSVLEADAAEELPTSELFRTAAGAAEWRGESAREARERHDYATSVLEAGRGLAAVETLDRVVEEIEAGDYRTTVTDESVTAAHASAVAAVEDAVATIPRSLAVPLARPAVEILDGLRAQLDVAGFSPERTRATLDYAARYASVVPAATTFVAERLRA